MWCKKNKDGKYHQIEDRVSDVMQEERRWAKDHIQFNKKTASCLQAGHDFKERKADGGK